MTVSADDLERHLAKLSGRIQNRRAGIYGPGTLSWEINREGAVMLGGGAAALLQLAHPFVAHAVDQHSDTRNDPAGRFQRTFEHVFAMVFGDLDHALVSARRVHALHRTIRGRITEDVGRFCRGDRYEANDERALLWVHATLVDTALRVYEHLVTPLHPHERNAYYAESKLFAYLFGIPDSVLPDSWEAFERYYADEIASDTIAVGEPARQMRRFLFTAPSPALSPLMRWYEAFTAGLLPRKLRAQLGFSWGPIDRALFARSVPILRAAYRVTPSRFKRFPAYTEAERRLAGQPPHDLVGRSIERLALGLLSTRRA